MFTDAGAMFNMTSTSTASSMVPSLSRLVNPVDLHNRTGPVPFSLG